MIKFDAVQGQKRAVGDLEICYFEHSLLTNGSNRSKSSTAFQAPYFSSPASRGRKEVGLNDLERLKPFERLELHSVRFSEIDFDHVRIFCHAGRRAFGDFLAGAEHDDTMRDIE